MARFARGLLVVVSLVGLSFPPRSSRASGPATPGAPRAASSRNAVGELVVHVMDVDHGDAILIQTPDGKNILIDAGAGEEVWSRGDMGKIVILPYLRKIGVEAIDMLIISHAHDDHIGGMPYLIEHIKVGEVVDSGYPHTSQIYRNLLKLVEEKGIPYRKVRAGDRLPFGKDVEARVLHPARVRRGWGKDAEVNNSSVVVRVEYGAVSFLFTGDLEKAGERDLLRAGYPLRSTVLKVGHHGNKASSTRSFISAIRPEAAVVSCGERPKFRRESPRRNLRSVGAGIYRTDLHGTVVVRTDGKTYSIKTERQRTFTGFFHSLGDTPALLGGPLHASVIS